MSKNSQTWRNYEELARHVLLSFADMLGISEVEAKQRLAGASGTKWEIDAKGVMADGYGFLIIECKERDDARLKQDDIASLAFKVKDVGAHGAVIVTSIGLQEGAEKIAKYCDFKVVYLPKNQSFEQFVAHCGNRIFQKLSDRANETHGLGSFVVHTKSG